MAQRSKTVRVTIIISILLLFLGGSVASTLEPNCVVTLGESPKGSERNFVLWMEPDGQLRDILGHEVEDDELQRLFRDTDTNKDRPYCLILAITNPEKTPLSVLSKKLKKITASLDPMRKATIRVGLKDRE